MEDIGCHEWLEGVELKVLGTKLSLTNATKPEVLNRIACGWRSFWSLKRLLLNQRMSIQRRLKLFYATVGRCVLWAAQSWTLRADELRQLTSARRSMLRRIVGTKRLSDESWVDWIKKATHLAEGMAQAASVRA